MLYKHFTKANVDVSELGVGTWAIGGNGYGEVCDNDSIKAIQAMLNGGVNLIDTAPIYGDGHAETLVGKAMKNYDRSKLFISTKVGVGQTTLRAKSGTEGFVRDSSFENILYECEQSLRRLNTNYIDFYFIHWPDPDTDFQETANALNLLKKEGKIRFVGVSNFSIEQIAEIEKYCQIDVIQPPFSMLVNRDVDLMKTTASQGIDSLTYGSLGAGILAGGYRTVPTFGPNDPRNGFYPYFKEPNFSKVMKLLETLDKISQEVKHPVAEVTLNWTIMNSFVSTTLCGVRNEKQAKTNIQAFDWKLTEEQFEEINTAIKKNIDFDGATPNEIRKRK